MSRLIMGISGALTLSLISGAAELARGRDLSPAIGSFAPTAQAHPLSSSSLVDGISSVNRASKSDRAAALAGSPASTQTVSLKLEASSDMSILVRIPVAAAAGSPGAAPAKPAIRKLMVACEPAVSVLNEVAKRLEPGRCLS